MLGNLSNLSEDTLLNMVMFILAQPKLLDEQDGLELEQIQQELIRRDKRKQN